MHFTYSFQLEDSSSVFILVNISHKPYSAYIKSEKGTEGKLTQRCVIKLVIAVSNWGLILLEWALESSISGTKDRSLYLPPLLGLQTAAELT